MIMDARITREETALLLNLTSPAHSDVERVRAEALRTRDAAIGAAVARGVKAVLRGIGATLAFIAAYPERMRTLRHLQALSERELADIGLTRADLSRVFDEDFAARRAPPAGRGAAPAGKVPAGKVSVA
jgi:uncharacterized protein YjiS (DUF1127 family)